MTIKTYLLSPVAFASTLSQLYLFSALYITTLFINTAVAQELRIVTEDLPPLQIQNNNMPPSGAMVEVVNLLLKESKIDSEIKIYPWARSYHLAKTEANVIIFSMLRDKKREDKFHWIGHLYTVRSHLAALKSNNSLNIFSLEDAKQHSVGTVRYDLAEDYLLEKGFVTNQNLYVSSIYHELWKLLFKGKTQLVFTNSVIWQNEVKSLGYNPDDVRLVYEVNDFANELYLAASLGTDINVVKSLQQALSTIKQDGRYQQILSNWKLN
ncbi:MAG: substrate-binding periplasmic protein [Thalassotalea sp.]